MQAQETKPVKLLILIASCIYVLVVILSSFKPLSLKPNSFLLQSLFSGSDKGYIIPASELAPLKPYLPRNGFFSFIMDVPYNDNDEHADYREFFWKAQNFVIPIILNRFPAETRAIVFCANDDIADRRLEETGYMWLHHVGNGKGIAVKNL